jgi:putative spermidine/putrescine transport system permease protein
VKAVTLPKQMWDGIRDEINPTIAAIAALLVFLTVFLMLSAVLLRRHQERLYTSRK